MADEMTNTSAETTETTEQATQTEQQSTTQTPETNYEDLYKTNRAFQSFVDKVVTKANETAVANALQKHQRLTDDKLSEAEKLKEMTSEQQAIYYKQKYESEQKSRERDKEVGSLKAQIDAICLENKIPPEVRDMVFDFTNITTGITAEDIQDRIRVLSQIEFYHKGEFEARLKSELAVMLKQAPTESHNNGGNNRKPPEIPKFI